MGASCGKHNRHGTGLCFCTDLGTDRTPTGVRVLEREACVSSVFTVLEPRASTKTAPERLPIW